MKYEVEIYIKGEERPIYALATGEDLEIMSEYLGEKCLVELEQDFGGRLIITLKDAYYYQFKPIETDGEIMN